MANFLSNVLAKSYTQFEAPLLSFFNFNAKVTKQALADLKTLNANSQEEKQNIKTLLELFSTELKLLESTVPKLSKRLTQFLSQHKIDHTHFGFQSMDEMALQLKNWYGEDIALRQGLTKSEIAAKELGKKNWYVGEKLFERYARTVADGELNQASQASLEAIHNGVGSEGWRFRNASGGKVKNPKNGKEYIPDFSKSEAFWAAEYMYEDKKGLDFGYLAVDPNGFLLIPLPVELKLPSAARSVGAQFAEFVERLAKAESVTVLVKKKDISKYSKSMLEEVAVETLNTVGENDLIRIKLDPKKFVFPEASIYNNSFKKKIMSFLNLNQTVLKPNPESWRSGGKSFSNNIDYTAKAYTPKDGAEAFNYFQMTLDVKKEFFENIYKIIQTTK